MDAMPIPPDPPAATITVSAISDRPAHPAPLQRLGADRLVDSAPANLGEALARGSGVFVRVNSRGETNLRVRGAEERQVQAFLDGAPLAGGWDGRADLGLVPAGLIRSADVILGLAPIDAGLNAVRGAIFLSLDDPGGPYLDWGGRVEGGLLGHRHVAAHVSAAAHAARFQVGFATTARDAQPVAEPQTLAFHQPDRNRRTNSDSRTTGMLASAVVGPDTAPTRLTLLVGHAERGVPPEGDRIRARFWRLPDTRSRQLILSSRQPLGGDAELRATAWLQAVDHEILSFPTAAYSQPTERQSERDRGFGARASLDVSVGNARISTSVGLRHDRHRERVSKIGDRPPDAPALLASQTHLTAGATAIVPVGRAARLSVGAGYDRIAFPATADKPHQPAFDGPALQAGLRSPLSDSTRLAILVGTRNRFPMPRELFAEALGRFLPNPDLQPERVQVADLVIEHRAGALTLSVNPFAVRNQGTIAQRNVAVDGQVRRQRYNLQGSREIGVDVRASLTPLDWLRLEAAGLFMDTRTDRADPGPRQLVQRPAHDLSLLIAARLLDGLTLTADLSRIGPAIDLGASNQLVRLPPSTTLDAGLRWVVLKPRGSTSKPLGLHIVASNLTDRPRFPQAGLPLPGRMLKLGVAWGS